MFKFFRNIRKKLLSEGNTGKYLKYAVGEIILVVIGILIALQINNWNEWKKERDLEIKILTEIRENIQTDFTDHSQNIDFMEHTIESSDIILNHLGGNIPYRDSLSRHFAWLPIIPDFYSVTSGYQLLSSKGFNLITNDFLRRDISFLYDNTHLWVKEFFAFLKGTSFRLLIENMASKFKGLKSFETYEPTNYDLLLADEEFKSLVQFNRSYLLTFKEAYQERLALGKELIDRIDQEIVELQK